MAGCAKNLEPVFAGITRSRDPTVAAVYRYSLRPVVGYAIQHVIGQVLQDQLSTRPLKREQTVARARIMNLSAKRTRLLLDPVEILVGVRRVDYQQVVFLVDTIDQQIVYYATIRISQHRVLDLVVLQPAYVVGRHALEQVERARALDFDFSHV